MEKIKELLKAMGGSDELSTELVGLMESHIKTTIASEKKRLQEEFDNKLTRVKTVCVEEVEAEKSRLARGVQHFLVTQIESIKRVGAKQLANEETEIANKLKTIKALVEGINVDEAKAGKDLQAVQGELKAVKEQLVESKTSTAQLQVKLNKFSEIAEKSLSRQRNLETQLTEAKAQTEKVIQESKASAKPAATKTLNEEKVEKAQPKTTVAKAEQKPIQEEDASTIDSIASTIA